MADSIQVDLNLGGNFVDELKGATGQALRLSSAFDQVQTSAKGVSSAVGRIKPKPIAALSKSLSTAGKAAAKFVKTKVLDYIKRVNSEAKKASASVKKMGQEGGKGAAFMGLLQGAAAKVTEKILESAGAIAQWAAETVTSERQAKNLFKAMTGGKVSFENMKGLALAMGKNVGEVTQQFRDFSEIKGFTQKDALGMVRLNADLEALLGADRAAAEIDKVKAAVEAGKSPAEAMAQVIKDLGPGFEGIGDGSAAAAVSSTTLEGSLNKLKEGAGQALTKVLNDSKPVIDKVSKALSDFASNGDAQIFIGALVDTIGLLVDILITSVSAIVGFVDNIRAIWVMLGISDVISGVVSSISGFVSWVGNIPSSLAAMASGWASAGVSWIQGLLGSLSIDSLVSHVSGMADAAISAIKSKFGIASPSKVMAGIGTNISEGLEGGIEPVDVSSNLVPSLPSAGDLAPPAAAGSSGSEAGATNIEITINAEGGGADDIAVAVRQALDEYYQGAAAAVGA